MIIDKEEFIEVNKPVLEELVRAGVLKLHKSENDERNYNIGDSDYSKKSILQPWSVWYLWKSFLTPWDFDIIKRLFRSKIGDSRILDYQKIIHCCKERIRQLEVENM